METIDSTVDRLIKAVLDNHNYEYEDGRVPLPKETKKAMREDIPGLLIMNLLKLRKNLLTDDVSNTVLVGCKQLVKLSAYPSAPTSRGTTYGNTFDCQLKWYEKLASILEVELFPETRDPQENPPVKPVSI